MVFKPPVCTICHGPDCLAFEEADERLTVVEQVILYPSPLKLSFIPQRLR